MENNEGTVLWKCGACSDCFCDLQVFATHKCVSSASGFGNSCINDQLTENYEDLDDPSNQVDQAAISAITALENETKYSTKTVIPYNSGKQSSKANRKTKPTVISVNGTVEKKVKNHQKGKRSLVWAYFTALDHKTAMCVLCNKVLAYCGTPTNLVYHLNRFHPNESEIVKSKQTDSAKYQYLMTKIQNSSSRAKSKNQNKCNVPAIMPNPVKCVNIMPALPSSNKKGIGDKIVELITTDLLPAKIVEGDGFKRLFSFVDPTFQMPDSKKVLKDLIPDRYNLESRKVKSALSLCEKVHLSIELWNGYDQAGYVTIAAHFISQEFNLKHLVLSSCIEPSTVNAALMSCISDWNLVNNVDYIVTDGSDKLVKVVKAANKRQVICLAHTLDMIIKDSFSVSLELNKVMEKCRSLVLFLKNDESVKQKVTELQSRDSQAIVVRVNSESAGVGTPNCIIKAKKDHPNYWNTTFYMLRRIYLLQNVITSVMSSLPFDFQAFTEDEWLTIKETITLLKPFEVVTLELCNERYPPLSKVIPMVHGLLSLIANCNSITMPSVERVRKDLLSQLRRRLGQIEHNITLAVTTLLDPRFKNVAFQSESAIDAAVQDIVHQGRKYKKASPSPSQIEMDSSSDDIDTDSLWAIFDKRATPRKEPEADSVIMSEIKAYFEDPLIDRKKDPVVWWRDYGFSRFPILGEVAKCMLSIPATSIPPARIFMKKESSFFEKRMSIKTKYVDQMLFLNSIIE